MCVCAFLCILANVSEWVSCFVCLSFTVGQTFYSFPGQKECLETWALNSTSKGYSQSFNETIYTSSTHFIRVETFTKRLFHSNVNIWIICFWYFFYGSYLLYWGGQLVLKWKLFRYILTLVGMKYTKNITLDILTVSFIFGHFVHGPLSSSSQSQSFCLRSHRVCEVPWRSRPERETSNSKSRSMSKHIGTLFTTKILN